MIRTIRVCDKCKQTEESTNTFTLINVHLPKQYINKSLLLCPTCFAKLNFSVASIEQSIAPPLEIQLYDLIYEIACEAIDNQ